MAKWMNEFVATFIATHNGREPTKGEIKAATPLFLNIDINPKGKGSEARRRFEGYFEGPKTVGEALNLGLRQDDIRHDSAHRFILLGDDAIEAYGAQTIDAEVSEVLMIEGPKVEVKKTRAVKAK